MNHERERPPEAGFTTREKWVLALILPSTFAYFWLTGDPLVYPCCGLLLPGEVAMLVFIIGTNTRTQGSMIGDLRQSFHDRFNN